MNSWVLLSSVLLAGALSVISVASAPRRLIAESSLLSSMFRLGRLNASLLALVAILLLAVLCLGSRLPIRIWDAAHYHALNPMRWAETGRFIVDSYGAPRSDPYIAAAEVYPNQKAVLPFSILLFTGREAGTALAQWPYLLLWFGSVCGLFRRAQLPVWTIVPGFLFVFCAPEVMLQSVEAYADIAFLSCAIAVVWACTRTWQGETDFRSVAITALCFGLLSGTKPTAYVACATLGTAFLAAYMVKSSGPPARRLLCGLGALAVVLLACAVAAGPWFFHAWIHLSNPVFPMKVTLGGRVLLDGPYTPDFNTAFMRHYTQAEGLAAWWGMLCEKWREPSIASWWGGLGAHAAILGLPASGILIAAMVGRQVRARFGFVTLLFGLLTISSSCLVLARFALVQLGFSALAFAWILSETAFVFRIALLTALGGLSLYNMARTAPAILCVTRPPEVVAFALLSGHFRAAMMDSSPDQFATLDYWREVAARDGAKLAIPASMTPWYARPLAKGATVQRVSFPEDRLLLKGFARQLANDGFTHVYVPRGHRAFDAMAGETGLFRACFGRVDCAQLGVGDVDAATREDAVLYEVVRREADHP
jgi:hypothetical protein